MMEIRAAARPRWRLIVYLCAALAGVAAGLAIGLALRPVAVAVTSPAPMPAARPALVPVTSPVLTIAGVRVTGGPVAGRSPAGSWPG